MNFENIKIEQLPGNSNETGIHQNQLKDYFNDRFFDDLVNNNIKIKQQGKMYIFEQKDINSSQISDDNEFIKKFYVNKKVFQEYLKEQQKKAEINLESDLLLKEFFNEMDTQNRLEETQKEIINEQIQKLDTDVEQLTKIDDIRDNPELLKAEIDVLLDWFEKNKTRPKAPRTAENRYSKHRFEQVIRDDIRSLKSIKRELKRYSYTTNMDYFANYINTMKSHQKQLETVRQMVSTGNNTAEIPAMLDSIKDVKKEALFQDIAASYNIEYNKILKDATLAKLLNKDLEGLQEYLIGVWSGDIEHPEQDKFYEKHKKDFKEIQSINPGLYREITTKRQKNNNPKKENVSPEYRNSQIERNNRYCSKSGVGAFDQIGNMFSELVYKGNDPKKQEARAQAGKIGALIGGVVLGFKFIQSLFSKKGTEGKRKNVALYGGGLFALLNMPKLVDRGKTAFGKSYEQQAKGHNIENTEIEQKYIKPPIIAMEALGGIPIQTLIDEGVVIEKYGKLKLDYERYENLTGFLHTNGKISETEKKSMLRAMNKIKSDESLLSEGLALLGIDSIKSLENEAGNNSTKTLLDSPKMAEHFNNISESPMNAILANEGLEPKNAQARYEMTKDYDPDNFGNNKTIEWMKSGLVKLKENNKNYTLDKMLEHPELNLETKTINKLKNNSGNSIQFQNYEEMFNAIQLTDFIKENFKGKSAKSDNPFHTNLLGNIEFDNTNRYELWKNETNVVNANFYKNTLENLSSTLSKHKNDYIKYLNERWKTEGKSQ
ncbi:MAG: hypothetical protein M0P94_01565 [Candidatus Absconditabacterales bacterium]|nr:hypothetical protein [Candidatus Absconditabacterales bacterium]